MFLLRLCLQLTCKAHGGGLAAVAIACTRAYPRCCGVVGGGWVVGRGTMSSCLKGWTGYSAGSTPIKEVVLVCCTW